MTGLLHEKEFSRTSFIKGGGALIVGFSLAGAGLASRAQAAVSPFASNGPYDMSQLDTWITINADTTASIRTGRVELGQGAPTGLLQIAAEELSMDMSQVVFVPHDTDMTPNTGETSASSSIVRAGPPLRAASATRRTSFCSILPRPASALPQEV